MKLSIIISAALLQQITFASSFTASIVAKRAFAPKQVFKGDLVSTLPYVQLEAMLTLLSYLMITAHEVNLPLSEQGQLIVLSAAQQKAYLMKKMKAKRGYQKLLKKHSLQPSVHNLVGERVIFSLNNIWKVNLPVVMPQTAELTDEDFFTSADLFKEIDFSTWAVLDLVAMGHEDIVTAFSNLDYQQIKNILIGAVKSWQLDKGEESLVQIFSEDLKSKSSFLQERLDRDEIDTSALEEEVAAMEKIASLAEKAEAIATFYAERSCADQNCYIDTATEELSYEEIVTQYLNQHGNDKVVAAAIDDLNLDGYMGLSIVSSLMTSYDDIVEFIAQEAAK